MRRMAALAVVMSGLLMMGADNGGGCGKDEPKPLSQRLSELPCGHPEHYSEYGAPFSRDCVEGEDGSTCCTFYDQNRRCGPTPRSCPLGYTHLCRDEATCEWELKWKKWSASDCFACPNPNIAICEGWPWDC